MQEVLFSLFISSLCVTLFYTIRFHSSTSHYFTFLSILYITLNPHIFRIHYCRHEQFSSSLSLPVCLSTSLPACPPPSLPSYPPTYLSVCLPSSQISQPTHISFLYTKTESHTIQFNNLCLLFLYVSGHWDCLLRLEREVKCLNTAPKVAFSSDEAVRTPLSMKVKGFNSIE